ncbi:MAG: alpha/beta hydrolase [Planctomycetes bacterium]|nr:alpha/beta hydrolase [Planctomycetota bacterium]
MQTIAELQTPVLYPAVQDFLNNLAAQGGPPLYELSPQEAREVLRGLQAVKVARPPADIEDRVLSLGPQGKVSIRIVRPRGVWQILPTIMYFHGGGWVLGDQDTHDRLIREIARGAGAALVFVNYTPAPEARYPVPIEEAYAATQWVAEHGGEIHVDSSRLAVAGDSVGGTMATVVALLAKQRGGPPICLQVLFYPVTETGFDTPSYDQFAEGYFLTREAMKWFWNQYAPDPAARSEPTASPLQASVDQLHGLPPALLIFGECDVLRDEGEAYARKLIEAGVPVTAARYLGITHDFVMLNALANTPAARDAIAQANHLLRQALAQGDRT